LNQSRISGIIISELSPFLLLRQGNSRIPPHKRWRCRSNLDHVLPLPGKKAGKTAKEGLIKSLGGLGEDIFRPDSGQILQES